MFVKLATVEAGCIQHAVSACVLNTAKDDVVLKVISKLKILISNHLIEFYY